MLDKINLTLDEALKQAAGHDTALPKATQKLLSLMEYNEPYTMDELLSLTGLKSRASLRKHYLLSALEEGLIIMGIPEKPTSRNQTYIKIP